MNFRILLSGIPVAVFYVLTRVAPTWVAILGGFTASAGVFWYTRRSHLLGFLAAFSFFVVMVSAIVGIITDSQKTYLASGIATDFLMVPAHLGSVAIGRPLVLGIARELFPRYTQGIRNNAPVVIGLSFAWPVFDTLHGIARLYLLYHLSVGEYIIISRLILWPPSALMTAFAASLMFREARRTRAPAEAEAAAGAPETALPEPAL